MPDHWPALPVFIGGDVGSKETIRDMGRETGDIIINPDSFGHVMMYYDPDWIIHGTGHLGFHKEEAIPSLDGTFHYVEKLNYLVYRPCWDKIDYPELRKAKLMLMADKIMLSATYGLYRMIRLEMGDSTFGPKALARLQKYQQRLGDGGRKFVTHITCAESVILCYQLAFIDKMSSHAFIKLDAAHAMPKTLGKWLEGNGWAKLDPDCPN